VSQHARADQLIVTEMAASRMILHQTRPGTSFANIQRVTVFIEATYHQMIQLIIGAFSDVLQLFFCFSITIQRRRFPESG